MKQGAVDFEGTSAVVACYEYYLINNIIYQGSYRPVILIKLSVTELALCTTLHTYPLL